MNITEYKDFENFFKAMISEMQRHDPDFGDSWKREWVSLGGEDLMDRTLDNKIGQCFLNYWRDPDNHIDELVDIANLCAMRWLRVQETES